jgi:uncharacterized membrane protein SpoIIM required for sporulation
MGIRDRDYMKRRSDDDSDGSSQESKAEELAQRFLNNLPRLLLYCGIGFAILILIALVVLKIARTRL